MTERSGSAHEYHPSKRLEPGFCGSILKLKQLSFSNSIMLHVNICCKYLLADDLYIIPSLILPYKKKEEATNPF